MKETGLRSKAYVVPVVVAAGLGMAGMMGLVSDGIVAADTASVTDTINVTVQPSCTFTNVSNETYAGSATNGAEVNNFNDNGQHVFNIFCNDHNGFEVSATAYDLKATGVEDVIAYTDNYTHTGVNSMWTAGITSSSTGVTVVPVVPIGGGTIFSSDTNTSTAGVSFTATYSAYVGTATPAGTYTGVIEYTLTASGTSSGNDTTHSGTGGNGGGSETGGNEEPGGEETGGGSEPGSGSSTGGDSQNSNTPSNTNNANSSNTNSIPKSTPLTTTLNNSYSTYNTNNTYNTYNTTNSQNGTSIPTSGAVATTSGDANENNTNPTTNNKDDTTSSSYEKPLGVTSTTKSMTSKESETMDPMPIVAAGAVTAAAVAGVALMRSGKKEEDKK